MWSLLRDHAWLATGLTVLSIVTLAASVFALPWLVARAPEDFFVQKRRARRHGASLARAVLRNGFGVVLVVAGVLMLVLPGQGLLTILVGVSLLDFPGKLAFERYLVQKKQVARALQWLRRRAGQPEFELPRDP
jgi:UPF0716 family protein affecting phage T7 exclusion